MLKPKTVWSRLFFAAVLIVAPFFFLFTLLSWHLFGILLLLLCEAMGTAFAVKVFLAWDGVRTFAASANKIELHPSDEPSSFSSDRWNSVEKDDRLARMQERLARADAKTLMRVEAILQEDVRADGVLK